jgi:hypothetical protein
MNDTGKNELDQISRGKVEKALLSFFFISFLIIKLSLERLVLLGVDFDF